MKKMLTAALAATAAVSLASPAFAAATIVDQNGPDLSTRIYTSQDDPNLWANVGTTVYANAGPANSAGHNTTFTGYKSYDAATQTFGDKTIVDIKDGGGFAQLNDHDFASKDLATQDLYAVVMDITDFDFSKYEFTIQLGDLAANAMSSSISVFYMLSGSDVWTAADGNPLVTAGGANQFILTAEAGTAFDRVLIASTGASIEQIKQNSVNPATPGAVPEPATWAMMLLGFGGIGMTMRRRRQAGNKLAQLA